MLPSVQRMNTPNLGLHLRTLQLLESQPTLNQRALAQELGISLGKTNYCLRALLAKGLLKAQNFKNSQNKLAYAYVLTPSGISARAELTAEFLQVKMVEFDRLQQEIAALRSESMRLHAQQSLVAHKSQKAAQA
jgi:EPS-associated MarR family transcriptional regulator